MTDEFKVEQWGDGTRELVYRRKNTTTNAYATLYRVVLSVPVAIKGSTIGFYGDLDMEIAGNKKQFRVYAYLLDKPTQDENLRQKDYEIEIFDLADKVCVDFDAPSENVTQKLASCAAAGPPNPNRDREGGSGGGGEPPPKR